MAQYETCPKCKSSMIAPAGSVWICFSCNNQFGGDDKCELSSILSQDEAKQEITEILADDAEDVSYGVPQSQKDGKDSNTNGNKSAANAEKPLDAVPLRQPDGLITVDGEDDNRESDAEYREVFNATVMAVAEMPFDTEEQRVETLGKIQERIHELDKIVRKAKIQQNALRKAKEHRLQFVSVKNRARLAEEDKNYKPRARKLDADGNPKETKAKKPTKAEKTAEAFLGVSLSTKACKAANIMIGLGMTRDQVLGKLRETGLYNS